MLKLKKLVLFSAVMIGAMGVVATPRSAMACCSCAATNTGVSGEEWARSIKDISGFVDEELDAHEDWLVSSALGENIIPAMKKMSDQLTAVAMQQVLAVGMFFDAKHQMETQRLIQTLKAKAHKDYHPSTGMCTIGSSVKSLAASERKGEVNALFLSQRSMDRQLGNANTAAQFGRAYDLRARIAQFRDTYCDPDANNGTLSQICNNPPAERINKDIDIVRTVSAPLSLKVDFSDANIQPDEADVLALASNLYAFDVFKRFNGSELAQDSETNTLNSAQREFMDMRALTAKRSVAENSFNNIVGMKTAGSGGSTPFLQAIISELGISDPAEIQKILGDDPSYYAQMEVLTKKLYQNPDFYTDLYDKPANVSRKGVALQAIGLMQKFDMLDSALRHEASLSVLLEMAVSDMQGRIENEGVSSAQ